MAEPIRYRRPPLGLPTGSVRALLSLMIVSVAITEIVRGHQPELVIGEALMIVLAHYFTARRLVNLPPELWRRLEQEGQVPPERYPLYLPRFSIRAIIVLSFIGAAGYLYQEGRLFTEEAMASIGLVLAYFVGVAIRGVSHLFQRWNAPEGLLSWFADLRAIIVIGATATLTVYYWMDRAADLPHSAQSAILTLLLFYFGAR